MHGHQAGLAFTPSMAGGVSSKLVETFWPYALTIWDDLEMPQTNSRLSEQIAKISGEFCSLKERLNKELPRIGCKALWRNG